jgi:hypothetical protein
MLVFAAIAGARSVAHAVPTQVSFAGRVSDGAGPIDGSVDLGFRLYRGGTQVWSEDHAGATADQGLVSVSLGSTTPLDDAVFDGQALELELVVDGAVQSPRLPVQSVPYAVRAAVADVADSADDATLFGGQPPSAYAAAGSCLPLGTTLTCPAGQKVIGLDAAGSVLCAPDADTQYTAAATGGLTLAGSAFSIATGGVTSARILDGTIASADLAANAITNAAMADNAVGSAEITDGSIAAGDLANDAVTNAKMADNAIGNAEMADNAIGNAEMADNAIGNAEIADNAVGSNEVIADSLAAGDLAAASVGTSELADDSIGSADVNPNWLRSGRSTSAPLCGTNIAGIVSFGSAFANTPNVTITTESDVATVNQTIASYCVAKNVTSTGFQYCCFTNSTPPDAVMWTAMYMP